MNLFISFIAVFPIDSFYLKQSLEIFVNLLTKRLTVHNSLFNKFT